MKIPPTPKDGESVKAFCRDAVKWMRANTINNVLGGKLKRSSGGVTISINKSDTKPAANEYIHPWKCTPNGDATIHVGQGGIHSYLDGSLSMAGYGDFAGGDVTVTAASGVIYGTIAAALSLDPIVNLEEEVTDSGGNTHDATLTLMRVFPDTLTSITIGFAETMPISTTVFYWEIAQVELVDGIAEVTKQVLRHDPMLWSFIDPP